MTTLTKRKKSWVGLTEQNKSYPLNDALSLVKKAATAKFDESIDVSVNLGIDAKKSDQSVRGSVVLPAGTGKNVRVAVFTQGDKASAAKAAGADARKLKIVVFKSGAEPIPALLGGHVDLLMGAGNNVLAHLESGKIRVLGISAPRRVSGALAGVPTLREQGVDAVVPVWLAAIGPRNMTAEQIAFWDTALAGVTRTEEWKAGLTAMLAENTYMGSAETRSFFAAKFEELKQLLTDLGLAK